MGNVSSSGSGGGSVGGGGRRRSSHHHPHHRPPPFGPAPAPPALPQPPPPSAEVAPNLYVFAAATPYPPQYPNPDPPPQYYPYAQYASGGYYPQPVPLPAPYDHHHRGGLATPEYPGQPLGWAGPMHRYPYSGTLPMPAPYVEHQKAVTIRNDINVKKETLAIVRDEENPGSFLVTFTFDSTVPGSITVYFFAKEVLDCNLTATKGDILKPVTIPFHEGLGQKFRQQCGTGIDFSQFEDELLEAESEVYPLTVKAEAASPSAEQVAIEGNQKGLPLNAQITQAVFVKKDSGNYHVKVVKQVLYVNGTRYELQEIYGIGNSVESETDNNDPGKECVICLSEPRDTTVLPCRHMCMCSGCANVLRYQTNRCPICRQPVERFLEIKVNPELPHDGES